MRLSMLHADNILTGCIRMRRTGCCAEARLPCTYLAHREPKSVIFLVFLAQSIVHLNCKTGFIIQSAHLCTSTCIVSGHSHEAAPSLCRCMREMACRSFWRFCQHPMLGHLLLMLLLQPQQQQAQVLHLLGPTSLNQAGFRAGYCSSWQPSCSQLLYGAAY